jgi:hypothetical protein
MPQKLGRKWPPPCPGTYQVDVEIVQPANDLFPAVAICPSCGRRVRFSPTVGLRRHAA